MPKFKVSTFDNELDEFFLANVDVHVERMDTTAFWIGIDTPDGERIMLNTGVHRGTWFFNVEKDGAGSEYESYAVQRPRRPKVPEEVTRRGNSHSALVDALKACIEGKVRWAAGAVHPSGKFCSVCGCNSENDIHVPGCPIEQATAALKLAGEE